MADVEAAVDGEGVEDGEEVVDKGVVGGIVAEVKVVGEQKITRCRAPEC